MNDHLAALLSHAAQSNGTIVALTGAGISAESGIPTFRGKEGYWTVGSRDYHPQELATMSAFSMNPEVVWPWYLYRRAVCRQAAPNAGHQAIARLEQSLGSRFILVTQNVDGLHLRAGNTKDKTYEIHGNIDYMRCAEECSTALLPVPDGLGTTQRNSDFNPEWRQALTCPKCGSWMRPHVLWFDESYDEARYRYESAINATNNADLLIVVGTSGATTLPVMMARIAVHRKIGFIDINPEANPFSELAERMDTGYSVKSGSGAALPAMASALIEAL